MNTSPVPTMQEAEELGPPVLSAISGDQQLDIEEAWLADMIQVRIMHDASRRACDAR